MFMHAGGVTVHSVNPPQFSYGIAIAKDMRRKGVARAALPLLFDHMGRMGFTRAVVQIAPDNVASLALHRTLGFRQMGQCFHYGLHSSCLLCSFARGLPAEREDQRCHAGFCGRGIVCLARAPGTVLREKCSRWGVWQGYLVRFRGKSVTGE